MDREYDCSFRDDCRPPCRDVIYMVRWVGDIVLINVGIIDVHIVAVRVVLILLQMELLW